MPASSQVAITGATGFVGTALVERLVGTGHRVAALVRERSDPDTVRWLKRRGARLVVAEDLFDADALDRLVDGADLVVHSAAVIGYRRRLWGAMAATNVMGTRAVTDSCLRAGTPRLVHVSSIAAVGISDEPVELDESVPYNADVLDSAYFDTKHEAELVVADAVARGLDAVIVNPAAIYGPSAARSNSSNVIVQILKAPFPLVPTGGINVVPLDTVIDGILAAAARGRTGRRYILGGENLHLAGLFERVGRAAGKTIKVRSFPGALGVPIRAAMDLIEPFVPDRIWFTPDMCAAFGRWLWFDTSRARDELGVTASSLDDCLAATIAQLRADGRLPSPPR